MPRSNAVRRENGKVIIVLDTVKHTLSEDAFIALLREALPLMQAIARARGETV